MGLDTKNTARAGSGYTGKSDVSGKFRYITGNLSGQDGTGFNPVTKPAPVAENVRKETADTLKRRKSGYRGL